MAQQNSDTPDEIYVDFIEIYDLTEFEDEYGHIPIDTVDDFETFEDDE